MQIPPADASMALSVAKESSLADRIAAVACDRAPVDRDMAALIVDRLIDVFAAALAAIARDDVTRARDIALGHAAREGACLFGCGARRRVTPEWAALANGEALGALDLHDGFLGAGIARPSHTIPPLLAVAQSQGRGGSDLLRAIATSYEIHIRLARSQAMCARDANGAAALCMAQAAGIGTLLKLPPAAIAHSVRLAACAGLSIPPAWPQGLSAMAGKIAVQAADAAMRGAELRPAAWRAARPEPAHLPDDVALPEAGAAKRAMAESFVHEHAASCHGQAVIDLALRVRDRAGDPAAIERIVLGSGLGGEDAVPSGTADEPAAQTRRFAIALQDGRFHHRDSTSASRAARADTIALCRKIELRPLDAAWQARLNDDTGGPGLGAHVEILTSGGARIEDALAVANAHPSGAHPFRRADYIDKFEALADGIVGPREQARLLEAIQNLPRLAPGELTMLAVAIPPIRLPTAKGGIFRVSA